MSYSITFGDDRYMLNFFGSDSISFIARNFVITPCSIPNFVNLGNPGHTTSVNYLDCVSPKASSVSAFIAAVLALNTETFGNIIVNETSTLDGAVSCGNNLTVAGTSSLTGAVTCGNNLTVAGTSSLTGAVTCGNNLTVAGTSSLTGAVNVSGLNIENSSGVNYITLYPANTTSATDYLWQIGCSSQVSPSNNLVFSNNALNNIPFQIYYASNTLLLAATINFSSQTGIGYQQIVPTTAAATGDYTGSGSITCVMPYQGTYYKKVVIYYNAYENTGTTTPTYTFPVAFSAQPVTSTTNSNAPAQTLNTNSSGQYVSITFDGGMTSSYTGFAILEGM